MKMGILLFIPLKYPLLYLLKLHALLFAFFDLLNLLIYLTFIV